MKLSCPDCGKPVSRVPDVLDVWFDSGVCTWASLEYPRKKELFESMWPSSFQTEGPDQFRGWWNSQMITSVLTFGKTPFKNVMMHGFVMDVKGIKLSKSKGNFIDPDEILSKHGRDALRFYLLSSPLWNDFYFSWNDIKETSRMFTVFWNTYSFIKMYADRKVAKKPVLNAEDKWIISRINSLSAKEESVRGFEMHRLVQGIREFIFEDFSRNYIKIIRNRVNPWYTGKDKDAAVYTLNYVLENLLKIMAPITPYVADHVYKDLYGKESVHLQLWPKPDLKLVNRELEDGMDIVKDLVESSNALRHENSIKLRWPLRELIVKTDKDGAKAIKNFAGVIKEMANVKKVSVATRKPAKGREFSNGTLALGEVLMEEALLREFCRNVQIKRKEAKLMVHDKIELWISADKKTRELLKKHEKGLLLGVGGKAVHFGEIKGDGKGSVIFEKSETVFDFDKA